LAPIEGVIDGYQSRNERMASLMRRFGISEEQSSGIDRVVMIAEALPLPAPDFRSGYGRTNATIAGPRGIDSMDRAERVPACYQHCAQKCLVNEWMTSEFLRERDRFPEANSAIISQRIATTIDANLITLDEKEGSSRKFARYLPLWA
jgi:predicted HTH transcriptional regulator